MTEVRLTDSLSRETRPVRPDASGRIGLYVCGPTVYDRAHIGNARTVMAFDILHRLLRHLHGDAVTFVHNITDVDDKIMARAAETGREIGAITEETLGWYLEDMDALGWLRPNRLPLCTEHIPQMVAMAERLIADGHAYTAEGHVLFAVGSWAPYGTLSRRSTDEMVAGARVEVAPYKRNPMDFVIWKPSTPDQPGWDSPWGRGRPGWHIECSAMAREHLGETFQIHGGGVDLTFPHHENERAQSVCANGAEMAEIWMHVGFLTVENEKMSKSLGNFITVRDLIDRGVPPEVVRFVLVGSYYRQPLDWTEKRVEDARRVINRWRRALDELADEVEPVPAPDVLAALADDLNTWEAIQAIDRDAKRVLEPAGDAAHRLASERFLGGLELLGFADLESAGDLEAELKGSLSSETADRIEALLAARVAARKARDFARADGLRDALVAAGVEVKDTPQGAEWRLAPGFDAARLPTLGEDEP
ncbi:MAG: cysteine--tRNA ligase [Paracoccaceae bacterium]